jgi:hypothetical protein
MKGPYFSLFSIIFFFFFFFFFPPTIFSFVGAHKCFKTYGIMCIQHWLCSCLLLFGNLWTLQIWGGIWLMLFSFICLLSVKLSCRLFFIFNASHINFTGCKLWHCVFLVKCGRLVASIHLYTFTMTSPEGCHAHFLGIVDCIFWFPFLLSVWCFFVVWTYI